MIVKKRTIPLKILILEACLRRLPKNHLKRQLLLEELSRRKAGFKGEQSIDFYLSSLNEKNYMIFHDLNLPDGQYNCQIDTFLLSSKFSLTCETKNMAGKLIFDSDNNQLIQINDGKEKGYMYPIFQAERHQAYIKKLIPTSPVEYVIPITNQHSILSFIGKNSNQIKQRVFKSDSFLQKINKLEKIYVEEILSSKELRKICRTLIKLNTPPTTQIYQTYGIDKNEIISGIHCPFCFYLPLTREKRSWYCPSCKSFNKKAHVNSLQDYFLLFDLQITNEQFRNFAHIQSPDTATRLLRSSNLNSSGSNKGTIYFPTTFPFC
ncbi:MAG: nuclease-related domain-containing protein [Bacillota bacterium]|nr:nuclease-related domain-containing protein [Bacillota bacterium]